MIKAQITLPRNEMVIGANISIDRVQPIFKCPLVTYVGLSLYCRILLWLYMDVKPLTRIVTLRKGKFENLKTAPE